MMQLAPTGLADRRRGEDRPCAPRPADRALDNLPYPLTSFVGRVRELAEVRRLLRQTRVLTLTGSGGVGKTRLSHEAGRGLTDAFADGVWLVELAAVSDAAAVPKAAAAVLGVREAPGRPLTQTLAEAIESRRLLLILDNCEHLIEACAVFVEAVLRACPGLQVLATSREPLGVAGETTLQVPSLTMPPCEPASASHPAGEDRLDVSRQPEAVRLFVERARAAAPGFALTGRNLAAVETICRRLDGIPLAIELAAARVVVLSPEQLAARLGHRFRLLSGGSRMALPRHQTLRALVDWSHDLLDDAERTLLRRLAVFAGGWTLEAAEAVCAGDGVRPADVLDLLSGLVAKSLVLPSRHEHEIRYGFLESLREYASEKLRDADEEAMLRERHRDWFVTLAERAEPELTGPRQAAWLDRLDRDRENLRAAQRWAAARGDGETLVRLGAALWQFWQERSDAADARELVDAIVPLAGQVPPITALARALRGAGMLAETLADFAICRSLLHEGLAVARQLEDRRTLASLLDTLGRQSFIERNYRQARALLTEAVAIFREIDDRHGLARALSHLGFLEYLEGRQEAARKAYREGLALARESGDPTAIAEFLDNLGRLSQAEEDLDGAARAYQQAVAIWQEARQGNWLAMALNNLGSVETLRGELGAARSHLAEALTLARKLGDRRRLAFTLTAVAALAAVAGRPERAIQLDAVAAATAAELGVSPVQPAYAAGARHVELARRRLGPRAEDVAATGRALTLAQAVENALAWLAEPEPRAEAVARPVLREVPPPARGASPSLVDVPPLAAVTPTPSGRVGLSRREVEVAALVARGLTNRQIAEELVITEGTAANHVKHILARLVFDSRVQIAAWAIQHGLHRRPAS